jgi:type I restriction enzyme S subunit
MNGTTIFNLSLHSLRNTPITIPPMNEQVEIVNEIKIGINKIDLAISKAQKEISSIKEYREALITDLVTGKLSVPQLQMS